MSPNFTLTEEGEALALAIRDYGYPCRVFDFELEREVCFNNMAGVESFINERLRSTNASRMKDGLSNVLYWGHYRSPGIRDARIRKLRTGVDPKQLNRAVDLFASLRGPALHTLKDLRLPEFSNLSFLSKLRTFLDPDRYCVIDLKLRTINAVKHRFKGNRDVKPTCIPVTRENEISYDWWVSVCGEAAKLASRDGLRPVDAERGFFQLTESGRAELADSLIRHFEKRVTCPNVRKSVRFEYEHDERQ